jgi:hypothetical protein
MVDNHAYNHALLECGKGTRPGRQQTNLVSNEHAANRQENELANGNNWSGQRPFGMPFGRTMSGSGREENLTNRCSCPPGFILETEYAAAARADASLLIRGGN